MDQNRVDRMLNKILDAVQENFDRGPMEPARVCEALVALAFSAATILKGTDHAEEMVDFFYRRLADEARRKGGIEP
jgi:hypothetical protein